MDTHRLLDSNGILRLYEDDHLLVLNKPAPFLVLPDRYQPELPNLFALLNQCYGKVYIVHRLDRETSGVLVVAKTPEAHAHLSGQFMNHEVRKIYHALLSGVTGNDAGTIDLPIGEGSRGKQRIDRKNGKPSTTEYRVIERFRGFSHVELHPRTGRTHQLRVHLQAIGTPILCDDLYGGSPALYLSALKPAFKQAATEERPLIQRTALHAASLTVTHPASGEDQTFTAEEPKDMEVTLKYLRKFCHP